MRICCHFAQVNKSLKRNAHMKSLLITLLGFLLCYSTKAQHFNLLIGTDIPYQFSIGIQPETKHFSFPVKTGLLIPPYSDAILAMLEEFGTAPVYINLLKSSYQLGWMNSLGIQYKFGEEKLWHTGADIRFDWLTAEDTPEGIIASVSGYQISSRNNSEIKLGLFTTAGGLRVGRKVMLGKKHKHFLDIEFSVYKHFNSASKLLVDNNTATRANAEIDSLLWEDVFKPYGYLGGIGLTYNYQLK